MKKCRFCAEDIQDLALVCKHCGRDLKASASKLVAPKKKTSFVIWVVLGFIVIAVLAALMPSTSFPPLPAATSRTATPVAPAAQSVSTPLPVSDATAESAHKAKAARELIPELVKQGLIKSMDLETGKVYINGPLWEGFELDAKQNLVRMISWYREAEYQGLPEVTLYESRTGKEFANRGALSGVTIQ